MSLSAELKDLKAGTIISFYKPVEENQIKKTSVWAQSLLPRARPEHFSQCLACVRVLLEQTRPVCKTKEQYIKLASLMTAYYDVYS